MEEQELSMTIEELTVLNRLFDCVDEVTLRAHYFTKDDIENIYSVLGKVREAKSELEFYISDRQELA